MYRKEWIGVLSLTATSVGQMFDDLVGAVSYLIAVLMTPLILSYCYQERVTATSVGQMFDDLVGAVSYLIAVLMTTPLILSYTFIGNG